MNITEIQNGKKIATRQGFGDGILELARTNENVIALSADLSGSLKLNGFIDEFPERFIQVGVAEANMMGLAAGLATAGKIPYTTTFANFSTGRVYDQIRQSIAYSHKNVKICASHAGLTLGEDGATHQILEDIGLMQMLPQMTVVVPCDYNQTKAATKAIADIDGPAYLRFGRPSWPVFTTAEDFVLGKAQHLMDGSDLTIIACGHMVWQSIVAAQELAEKGITVDLLNIHTIKPIDEQSILASARKTGGVVTAEEHQIIGGLGSRVAQILGTHAPMPIEFVGVKDSFGESGKPADLLKKYGLAPSDIVAAANKVLQRTK